MAELQDQWDQHVKKRYDDAIDYYWRASRCNKQYYKITRILTVVLGAVVTLIASLSSSEYIAQSEFWKSMFAFGTPVISALLTIIAGFSQSFQWGSAWQNMVVTAQRLERERDRFLVTEPSERDHQHETELLNEFIISESKIFFDRMLGGSITAKEAEENAS